MQSTDGTGKVTTAICHRGPYDCHIEMWVDRDVGRALVPALYPVLREIDPTFKNIIIKEKVTAEADDAELSGDASLGEHSRGSRRSEGTILGRRLSNVDSLVLETTPTTNSDTLSGCNTAHLDTPAIAIGVFLPERESTALVADDARRHLRHAPWRFHHRNELVNARRPPGRSAARQDYYEFSPTLPLFTVGAVHAGNRHLRFTIFTSSMPAMRDFYTRLTGRGVMHQTDSFCLFELSSRPGFDLQLALKHSPRLRPRPLPAVFLHFRICSFRSLDLLLSESTRPLAESVWATHDPDGNRLILQETGSSSETVPSAATCSSGDWCEDTLAGASPKVAHVDSDADHLADLASCDSGRFSSSS
ncbi:hypothetical protein LSAT2_001502 [Lamellibrachia satsuma]|nr:hypothetical protein LSAT2_001502 [Lamellibrachia satsuma]